MAEEREHEQRQGHPVNEDPDHGPFGEGGVEDEPLVDHDIEDPSLDEPTTRRGVFGALRKAAQDEFLKRASTRF